ncbi:hypothetical protein CJF40_08915 [Pseudomonas lundensis]|jgi:hypothetical protein|uniref:Uncharacterized protein n=1 Tax=Pseudomonas lundensis TaxID=86185 RepID=A0AAX2H696_9PSED|nr:MULTISPECIES: hypothetical protein [Pseudomonas]MBM1183538.1 hypothetical protein [Pseudomonas lundensis]MBM1186833.1 hypothetical protein [Pseudomonas lundensis]MCT8951710.1 hypothetical protein [Pseudomonas lundensis]NMZ56248.1 hypothetical protein [Pseudomonas lundensis]NNA11344.1 hypothetical protein [Pseudomonas lundensis]
MAAVLVGQFHARDAEGRVYSVHEFQDSTPGTDGQPVITYKLAIGDRVKKISDTEFELVQSGIALVREPEPAHS